MAISAAALGLTEPPPTPKEGRMPLSDEEQASVEANAKARKAVDAEQAAAAKAEEDRIAAREAEYAAELAAQQ